MELYTLLIILLLALPMLGAAICAFLKTPQSARTVALAISTLCFVITIPLLAKFNWHRAQPLTAEFDTALASIQSIGFDLRIGVDAISIWLLTLTTFLMPLAIAASFASIKERPKEYFAWMLALQAAMTG